MSEEYVEAEEQALSQEELFEQHKAEIDERFEEKGFFKRLGLMFSGLSKPRSSAEYKIARTELQRLKAPILAIFLPVVGVIVLIVVTAVQGQKKDHIIIDVAVADEQTADLVDEPDPPEEEIDMTQDIDVNIDIATDVPTPEIAAPAPPSPSPGGEPDKVSAPPSPVTMASVAGTVKPRGIGNGDAGGFGTIIGNGGKGQNTEGCLIGILIDFKRDGKGERRTDYNANKYWSDVKSLVDANFSPEALSKFCVLPKRVALTHLWIPPQSANNGPKAFGAETLMKPAGWGAYYKGDLLATENAKYRFWGYFDDMLVVKVDDNTVLESNWGTNGSNPMHITGFQSSDKSAIGKVKCPQRGTSMVPGHWFEAKKGKKLKMELICGERPGGAVGGLLLIEKMGYEYQKGPDGKPLIPIFCSRPLSMKEKKAFQEGDWKGYPVVNCVDGKFPIGVESPVFNKGKVTQDPKAPSITKGDVSVDVDI